MCALRAGGKLRQFFINISLYDVAKRRSNDLSRLPKFGVFPQSGNIIIAERNLPSRLSASIKVVVHLAASLHTLSHVRRQILIFAWLSSHITRAFAKLVLEALVCALRSPKLGQRDGQMHPHRRGRQIGAALQFAWTSSYVQSI
jgi:hypothetical protein